MAISGRHENAHRPPLAGQTVVRHTRPAEPASHEGRQGAFPAAGRPMNLAAITLSVASYLHRDGHIPLGFTVINGERLRGTHYPSQERKEVNR